jgi:hexosaminidase
MIDAARFLHPRPHEVELTGGEFVLDRRVVVGANDHRDPRVARAAARLAEEANGTAGAIGTASAELARHERARRATNDEPISIVIEQTPSGRTGAEGYLLSITEDRIVVAAQDAAGAWYGIATATQLIALARGERGVAGEPVALPRMRLRDAPDFAHRGVLLDVSRDKAPEMATLFLIVDRLASWKINELQLYTEHMFAYRGHEAVWRDASAYTPEEMRALDEACRERFIELVPNQQSFGHMHRWLVHEPYRALAECPQGIDHPFSLRREPYSLCPSDPRSVALLADLYGQLLDCFQSRRLDVGLDETFDLGTCRSAELCERVGVDRVYLDFLMQIHALARNHGRTIQFWSDVIKKWPERLGEIPSDAVVLDWGYEADHPFDETGRLLSEAGLSFYVCPGTSAWNSFAGRTDNAIENLAAAARSGKEHGASGYLVTDWGDCGHLQPLVASWTGLVVGAGLAWNAGDERLGAGAGASAAEARAAAVDAAREHVAALLDRHVFGDAARVTGRAVCDLGNAYRDVGERVRNASALFLLAIKPDEPLDSARLTGVHEASLGAALARVEAVRGHLSGERMACADARETRAEIEWSIALLSFACRLGAARARAPRSALIPSLPAVARASLASELDALIDAHARVWAARNRPGGRDGSRAWLERTHTLLRA